jgi:ABC-type transport system involved in cytochrome bd biosynthesis fused ATPase/permease subunit
VSADRFATRRRRLMADLEQIYGELDRPPAARREAARASPRERTPPRPTTRSISLRRRRRRLARRSAAAARCRASACAAARADLGILGPNGAGKSTLLGILATLLRPTGRQRALRRAQRTQGAALRARIGVLGHDLFLYPELTARENLEFFAGRAHGLDDPAAAAREALARAGLDERGDDPVSAFFARHAAARGAGAAR